MNQRASPSIWPYFEQNEAVLISKHDGQSGSKTGDLAWKASEWELHCTGLGKALIAFLPAAEVDGIIQAHGLGRHNENTISNPKRFREELERVARIGYAADDEEDELGMRCIRRSRFRPQPAAGGRREYRWHHIRDRPGKYFLSGR